MLVSKATLTDMTLLRSLSKPPSPELTSLCRPSSRSITTACPDAYTAGLVSKGGAYPFGIDPTWHGTRTELQFTQQRQDEALHRAGCAPSENCLCPSQPACQTPGPVWPGPCPARLHQSCAAICCLAATGPGPISRARAGVIQMDVGILLSFLNQRYFRDALSTYCEFIPQMVFLNGLFGYLSLLIVGKWISGSTADLYHVMIYMFLSPGSGGLKCADGKGGYGCAENEMFPGQGPLQARRPSQGAGTIAIGSSQHPHQC